ncbi:hypothetical protein Tco_1323107 [Tanacetum coccineum]
MEKETGNSHLQMLVEWLQDENERRDRLLEIQAELEDYCEKTSEKEQPPNMDQIELGFDGSGGWRELSVEVDDRGCG